MRILDEMCDSSIDHATLLLTRSEALELVDSLESLLAKGQGQPTDVPSEDYQKQLTVAVYDPSRVNGFNRRHQKLIREDA